MDDHNEEVTQAKSMTLGQLRKALESVDPIFDSAEILFRYIPEEQTDSDGLVVFNHTIDGLVYDSTSDVVVLMSSNSHRRLDSFVKKNKK